MFLNRNLTACELILMRQRRYGINKDKPLYVLNNVCHSLTSDATSQHFLLLLKLVALLTSGSVHTQTQVESAIPGVTGITQQHSRRMARVFTPCPCFSPPWPTCSFTCLAWFCL